MCSSPQLIAACHVLHRLLMPRHSPCALYSLTSSEQTSYPSLPPSAKARSLRCSSSPSQSLRLYSGLVQTMFGSLQELCRLQLLFLAHCYITQLERLSPFYFLVPQHFAVDNLCCLLHNTFFLFVQFSRCTSGQNRMQTLDTSSTCIRP